MNFITAEILLTHKYGCVSINKYNENEECVICSCDMKDKYVLKLSCGHTFHRKCILDWLVIYKNDACVYKICECTFD